MRRPRARFVLLVEAMELRTEKLVTARPSGPIPPNVRVYRARTTMPWSALWILGAFLLVAAVVFTIVLLATGGP